MNRNGPTVGDRLGPGSRNATGTGHGEYADSRSGVLGWVVALVRARCPRCRKGRMFRGSVTMNDPCPVCGLIFQREEGYFLGAMYFSYVLSSLILGAFYFAAMALFPNVNSHLLVLLILIPYLPLVPLVFRYSRVLWVYAERLSSPVDESAGAYEKHKRHRIEEGQAARHGPTD